MTPEHIIASLANSTAETIENELRRHNLTQDDALTVLAGLCWSIMRGFRPEGDIDENLSDLCKMIYEADAQSGDELPEPGRRLH